MDINSLLLLNLIIPVPKRFILLDLTMLAPKEFTLLKALILIFLVLILPTSYMILDI